jgi:glyoxylase-like metal-dependent hydrolase (beta-lactamase superfamily II)
MTTIDVLTYGFSLVSDQGPFGFSTISLLTVGEQRILVDTGPASRRTMLQKTLDGRGLEPADIDLVVLTHMHWDHCANADLFPDARVLVHPKEIDYSKNPSRGDYNVATYFADMLDRLKVEPISEGDRIADGVTVIDTPGHTKGHISIAVSVGGRDVLVSGDAMPDGGTVRRGLPYNVFWDVDDAAESVEKMVASAEVFYPGHDRPFTLEGDQVGYLEGPIGMEVTGYVDGGAPSAMTYVVHPTREPNIDPVQKG